MVRGRPDAKQEQYTAIINGTHKELVKSHEPDFQKKPEHAKRWEAFRKTMSDKDTIGPVP